MKIYKVWIDDTHVSYDTHDSMVVVAESKEEALELAKNSWYFDRTTEQYDGSNWDECRLSIKEAREYYGEHLQVDEVQMTKGVVVASYNAG